MIKFERAKNEVRSRDKKWRRFWLTAGGLRIHFTREEAVRLCNRMAILLDKDKDQRRPPVSAFPQPRALREGTFTDGAGVSRRKS